MHVLFLLLLYYVVLDYYCHFSLCRSKNCLFLSLPTEHKNNICPSLFMVFPPKIGKFDMMCQLSHVTTTSTNSKVGKNRNTYVKISAFICNNLWLVKGFGVPVWFQPSQKLMCWLWVHKHNMPIVLIPASWCTLKFLQYHRRNQIVTLSQMLQLKKR